MYVCMRRYVCMYVVSGWAMMMMIMMHEPRTFLCCFLIGGHAAHVSAYVGIYVLANGPRGNGIINKNRTNYSGEL
ncbi:hypothetical protein F4813DRAFT_346629 [Daldinia decipiens]|uniref:uncharacterized protein n=1 Tax=Daldinia decipiens TaxID=326647 RepID=UPI0020C3E8ED|nr:uncharacterized protein F4813DRAFT_346629 [Daldinia decipiens]KAI1661161.1 hypothetical protein F4813DRAFT_346629 [Daldinia decipiens]